jgi:hypothetical protein
MSTWPNRGASGGPCGGLVKKDRTAKQPKSADRVDPTHTNRPPRKPGWFTPLRGSAECVAWGRPRTTATKHRHERTCAPAHLASQHLSGHPPGPWTKKTCAPDNCSRNARTKLCGSISGRSPALAVSHHYRAMREVHILHTQPQSLGETAIRSTRTLLRPFPLALRVPVVLRRRPRPFRSDGDGDAPVPTYISRPRAVVLISTTLSVHRHY